MRVLLFLCLVTTPLCLAQNPPTVSVTECAADGKDCLDDVKQNGIVEVVKGKQIRLVCVGEGDPGPIRVSWRLKDGPAALASRSADNILETNIFEDGILVCTAMDAAGRATDTEVDIRAVEEPDIPPTARITVCQYETKNCLGQNEVTVPRGTVVTLVCLGEGSHAPIRLSWSQGTRALAASGESEIMPPIFEDSTFVCTATDTKDRLDTVSVSFKVSTDAPVLSVSLTECVTVSDGGSCLEDGPTEVELGTVVRMVCRSQGGTPPVILNWMVEGKRALKTEAARDGIKELTVTIATDTTFICTGIDAEGKEASLSKTFRIKPQVGEFLAINIIEPIPEAGGRLERAVGEVVTVVCEGRGAPRLPTDLTFNFPAGGEAPAVTKSETARVVKLEAQWTVIAGTQIIDCKGSNGNFLGTVTSRMTIVGN